MEINDLHKAIERGEDTEVLIRRILHDGAACGRFCDMPVNSKLCLGVRCSDQIRIFIEREVKRHAAGRS